MTSKGTILVTGASGFVGCHIVNSLLIDGYSVRALVRRANVDALRKTFDGRHLEVVEIQDIAKDDLTAALKAVTAVIHSASPLAGRASPHDILNATLHGVLNVLRHCVNSGVSKVIITSTWATVADPDLKQTYEGKTFDQNSWGEISPEEILDGTCDPLYVYLGSKILAEKAAWKFAEDNPGLDIATINPPFIYGPFFGLKPSGPAETGTNAFILALIAGPPGRPLPPLSSPYYVDVRDVARSHVLALRLPKVVQGPLVQKRFIISAGALTWKDAAEYLAETRPELSSRLPSTSAGDPLPSTLSKNDVSLAANSLGLFEYIRWQKTVEDTVDDLLFLEKEWVTST